MEKLYLVSSLNSAKAGLMYLIDKLRNALKDRSEKTEDFEDKDILVLGAGTAAVTGIALIATGFALGHLYGDYLIKSVDHIVNPQSQVLSKLDVQDEKGKGGDTSAVIVREDAKPHEQSGNQKAGVDHSLSGSPLEKDSSGLKDLWSSRSAFVSSSEAAVKPTRLSKKMHRNSFARKNYTIQYGAFTEKANAEQLQRELLTMRIQAYIFNKGEDDPYYRVRSGRFIDRKSANEVAGQVKVKMKLSYFIATR